MKNKQDYLSGWTTPTVNPATGRRCSGGAARNLKIAQLGGANAIQVTTVMKTMESLQPIINTQQNQINQQQSQINVLTKSLTTLMESLKNKNDQ